MVLVAHSSRLRSILAGQPWQQELKIPVSYQQLGAERRDALLSSVPLLPRSQTQGVGLPTFRTGVLTSLSALVTVSGGVQGPPDPDSLSLRLPLV